MSHASRQVAVRARRTHVNLLGGPDLGRLEELPRLLVRPVLGRRVLTLAEVREDALHVVVLLDELERRLGADALDRVEVVATAEHAHVDELQGKRSGLEASKPRRGQSHLVHRELETLEDGVEADHVDGHLARFGEGEVAENDGRVERERVHVLRTGAIDLREQSHSVNL